MEKKKTTKKSVKKTPAKTVKKVEKNVEEVKEVKEVEKTEKVKKEIPETGIKELVYSILYFGCSVTWVLCGFNRAIAKERFAFDLIVSILLFVVATIYFMKFKKLSKQK